MGFLPRDEYFEIGLPLNVFVSRKVKRKPRVSFIQLNHLECSLSLVCFFELFLCFAINVFRDGLRIEDGRRGS